MKITLRIPTKDQYAFVEAEYESVNEGPEIVQSIKDSYDALKKAMLEEAGEGLPPSEWRELLNSVMLKAPRIEPIPTERLNKEQYYTLKEIKNWHVRTQK